MVFGKWFLGNGFGEKVFGKGLRKVWKRNFVYQPLRDMQAVRYSRGLPRSLRVTSIQSACYFFAVLSLLQNCESADCQSAEL
jgi:hypothetical protein